jgi:hypothetical protein
MNDSDPNRVPPDENEPRDLNDPSKLDGSEGDEEQTVSPFDRHPIDQLEEGAVDEGFRFD